MDYWEGKYMSVCKACGKLGGSGGMLLREILIFDLFLVESGTVSTKHNLLFIMSLKLLCIKA